MKTPTHYIAYPDKSWIDPVNYEQYPDSHRMRLDGATCILEADFKQTAYRNESFWNPIKIGTKIETRPPMHFIVWRVIYKTGRISISAQDTGQYQAYLKKDPTHFEGAACIRAVSLAQAEQFAVEERFWEPIDPNDIDLAQEGYRREKAKARAHYPEAW